MITLPPDFVSTKYPGYFWNTKDERLYSVKVTGMLKPLHFNKPTQWNHFQAGYQVSVGGMKRYLFLDYLKKLTPKNETFPIWK